MSIISNVIVNNLVICAYILILYYLVTPTKTISVTEYLYYFLIGAFVIIPFTGYAQYYFFYNLLNTPTFASAYLGPLEEITKLIIPFIAIHLHPKRKSMSVTDFVLIGVAIGSAFSIIENILYSRVAVEISRFNLLTGSFIYSEGYLSLSPSADSITFYNHFIYPAFSSIFLGLKNRLSKNLASSILLYILTILSLVYSMYVHGFFNYCLDNGFFGIIQYPDNKLLISLYNICLRGKYLDLLFIIMLIAIVIYEFILLQKASKQPGLLVSNYFISFSWKLIIFHIFEKNKLSQAASISIYKKYLFFSVFHGVELANEEYKKLIKSNSSPKEATSGMEAVL